jgi:molybdopterin synthase catalytic subunit
MEIEIQLTGSPIPAQAPPRSANPLGAWVEFRGVVREEEAGEPIAALVSRRIRPWPSVCDESQELADKRPAFGMVIHRVGHSRGRGGHLRRHRGRHRASVWDAEGVHGRVETRCAHLGRGR